MPWGKYRGYRMNEIPAGYLAWLVEESDAEGSIRRAAKSALADRLGFEVSAPPTHCYQCERYERLADRWPKIFQRLALVAHPDRGGTSEAMQMVNELNDLMKASVA